jgi:molybdopterin-guanine dinucleotide biosynthesis protein A
MGRPKLWLPFGKQSLLNRVVDRISPVVSSVLVVAAAGQCIPDLPPAVTVVRDAEPHCGPLGGLAAGLEAIAGKCDVAFVSACDSPFVSDAVIRRLLDLLGENLICIPRIGDRLHPLAAVYRVEIAATVHSNLSMSRLRLLDLIEQVPTRTVNEAELLVSAQDLMMFGEMNTHVDYERALRDADLT